MRPLVALVMLLALALPIIGQDDLNKYFSSKGLIDATGTDASLKVELRYAGPDNFLGEAVYKQISGAWLRPEAAAKLLKAQALLKARRPGYSLLIYDAARPMSVQRAMWNLARKAGKAKYVSNPANGGGLHNYGMAVDLTIVDASGQPLDMGAPFDHFGPESHINDEKTLLQSGKISSEAYSNRLLLRTIMTQAGFRTILYEWWHFNACSREEAKARLPLL
ncbi:MAG: M15 family metallopeptidase [Tannerellaceae bacterium]|jgi:D-alanyl-D-alanine dipeptidase|nr:M15 family metallopeptidase [Tannerellaceae bacterium]